MLRIRRWHDAAELRVRSPVSSSGHNDSSKHNDDVTRFDDYVSLADVTDADVTHGDGTARQHCSLFVNESLVFQSWLDSAIQQFSLRPVSNNSTGIRNYHDWANADSQLREQYGNGTHDKDANTSVFWLAGCSHTTTSDADGTGNASADANGSNANEECFTDDRSNDASTVFTNAVTASDVTNDR